MISYFFEHLRKSNDAELHDFQDQGIPNYKKNTKKSLSIVQGEILLQYNRCEFHTRTKFRPRILFVVDFYEQ